MLATAAQAQFAVQTYTGTVQTINYDATTGFAIGFELKTSEGTRFFTFATPSEQMTENLNAWKDAGSSISVDDVDDDQSLEQGDTITE